MIVRDLGREAVSTLHQVDLQALGREPDSPIGRFPFNQCTCGVGAFVGRPPWEHHRAADELLFVLAGESELTVLEETGPVTTRIFAGQLAVVPQGCWHSNDAMKGVTMLFITPADGNEHSWDDPRAAS